MHPVVRFFQTSTQGSERQTVCDRLNFLCVTCDYWSIPIQRLQFD